jgi:predicted ArsR family transcriptional regulator
MMHLLLKRVLLISTCVVAEAYVVRSPLLHRPGPASRLSGRPSLHYSRSTTSLSLVPYEQLMEKLPSKAVIDAVAEAKNDKVVAADVATRAGVSLSQARKDLTALVSSTRVL